MANKLKELFFLMMKSLYVVCKVWSQTAERSSGVEMLLDVSGVWWSADRITDNCWAAIKHYLMLATITTPST